MNEQVKVIARLREVLKADTEHLVDMAVQQIDQRKELEHQLRQAVKTQSRNIFEELAGFAEEHHGIKIITRRVDAITDLEQLKDLAVDLKHHLKSGVVVLGTVASDKPQIVVATTDDLKGKVPAGSLARVLGGNMGGGGGGSARLGTGGGKNVEEPDWTLAAVPDFISQSLDLYVE